MIVLHTLSEMPMVSAVISVLLLHVLMGGEIHLKIGRGKKKTS